MAESATHREKGREEGEDRKREREGLKLETYISKIRRRFSCSLISQFIPECLKEKYLFGVLLVVAGT